MLRVTGAANLTERELKVLRDAWDHQQHSAGQPMYFAGLGVHVRSDMPVTDEDVEGELIDELASLEQKGYLRRVGETQDSAKFPLYEVTQIGILAAERHLSD